MHTLYMVYDSNNKVTDFVIDNVSATLNFISLDKGPLSYVQSIIDNLNAYIKKNGDLTVDNDYIGRIRHGQFDETYGTVQDKRTDNLSYAQPVASSAATSASSSAESSAASSSATASAESSAATSAESSATTSAESSAESSASSSAESAASSSAATSN